MIRRAVLDFAADGALITAAFVVRNAVVITALTFIAIAALAGA